MYHDQLLPVKWVNDFRRTSRASESLLKEIVLRQTQRTKRTLIGEITERR